MSLIVVNEPREQQFEHASDLGIGTWFVDKYGQIYLLALDDRTNERRVVCVGDFCKPFIPNITLAHIQVGHVLAAGTILQITAEAPLLEEGR